MTTKLRQTVTHKRGKKRIVSFFLLLSAGFITSCGIMNREPRSLIMKHDPGKNCVKYALNYTTDERIAERTRDTLFVRGRMRICATNAIVPFTEISVLNDGTSEEIKVVSDRKGRFFVQTDPQVLYHKGFGYFGPIGNTHDLFGRWRQFSRYGLYLATHEVLINEMREPRLRKELKKLRKEMEREERMGSRRRE